MVSHSKRPRRRRGSPVRLEQLETRRLLAQYIVTTVEDVVAVDGLVSLREAVLSANANTAINADVPAGDPGDQVRDAISFAPEIEGQTLRTQSPLVISDVVVITGTPNTGTTLDGGGSHRLFEFAPRTDATLASESIVENLILTGGSADRGGAVIVDDGHDVLFRNMTFRGNQSSADGGALAVGGSNVTVNDSLFRSNTAGGIGGAILNDSQSLIAFGTRFEENSASNGGGAYAGIQTSYVHFRGSDFDDNAAVSGLGGGILLQGEAGMQFQSGTMLRNLADSGGAISVDSGTVTFSALRTFENRAVATDVITDPDLATVARGGGAIYNRSGNISISESRFESNQAIEQGLDGGSILSIGGRIDILLTRVITSNADRYGGGIALLGDTESIITEILVGTDDVEPDLSNNVPLGRAKFGGAIYIGDRASVTASRLGVQNTIGAFGGGIRIDAGATLHLADSHVIGIETNDGLFENISSDDSDLNLFGGGISNAGTLTMVDVRIERNDSIAQSANQISGAAGIVNTGTLVMQRSLIANNVSNHGAGGLASIGPTAIATLENVTVSGNLGVAVGGVLIDAETDAENLTQILATLTASTITDNEATGSFAGIRVDGVASRGGTTAIVGSIVSGNSNESVIRPGGGQLDLFGQIESRGNNLFGTVQINTAAGQAIDPAELTGDFVFTNPDLGPLANNAGRTKTHSPLPTSLAIGRGIPLPSGVDGRGRPRVAGDGPDIGAVETDLPRVELDNSPVQALVVRPAALIVRDIGGDQLIPGQSQDSGILFRVDQSPTATATIIIEPIFSGKTGFPFELRDARGTTIASSSGDSLRVTLQTGASYAVVLPGGQSASVLRIRAENSNVILSKNSLTNIFDSADVNLDGRVTPLDALLIVNALRRQQLNPQTSTATDLAFRDVDADGSVRVLDALLIINRLRRQAMQSGAEGEFVSQPTTIQIDSIKNRDRVFGEWVDTE